MKQSNNEISILDTNPISTKKFSAYRVSFYTLYVRYFNYNKMITYIFMGGSHHS